MDKPVIIRHKSRVYYRERAEVLIATTVNGICTEIHTSGAVTGEPDPMASPFVGQNVDQLEAVGFIFKYNSTTYLDTAGLAYFRDNLGNFIHLEGGSFRPDEVTILESR